MVRPCDLTLRMFGSVIAGNPLSNISSRSCDDKQANNTVI